MYQENVRSQADKHPRSSRRLAGVRPHRGNRARPLRVLPLAIGAVIAVAATAAAASSVLWDLSHHRYAAEIIRDAL
jgi:hypothetical protein